MNKGNVDLVLIKAMDFLRDNLKNKITTCELFCLSGEIWHRIQQEYKTLQKFDTYYLTKSDLDALKSDGFTELVYDDGSRIRLKIREEIVSVSKLEDGSFLLWHEEEEE